MNITITELQDALAAAAPGNAPEDARTAQQLAETANVPLSVVQKTLRKLHAEGRLRHHRAAHVGVDGRHVTVPAYTILPKP